MSTTTTSAPAQAPPTGSRAVLVMLLAAATLVVAAGSVLSPVVAIIRGEFALGPTQAGLVITTHSLLIAVSGPLIGSLIDRVGTRKVLIMGLFAYGVFGGAGLLVPGYAWLIASRVLFGISAAAVVNGLTVSLLNLWHGEARDTVMGYRATASSLGGLLWPILGGVLGAISWRGPFAVYLIALPIALAVVWLVPDTRPERTDQAAGGTVRMPTLLRRTPTLLWSYALMFTLAMLLYAVVIFIPQRMAQFGITDPLIVSLLLSATMAATATIGLLYGRIRRRVGYRPIIIIGLILPAVGFVLLATAGGPWLLLAGTPVLGLGMGLINPAAAVLTGTAVPDEARGRATSYLNSTMLLGQFASPLLFGTIAGPLGIQAAFIAAAALAALVAIAAAAAFRPLEPTVG